MGQKPVPTPATFAATCELAPHVRTIEECSLKSFVKSVKRGQFEEVFLCKLASVGEEE